MLTVLHILEIASGLLLTLASFLLLFRFRWSKGGPMLWIAKSFVCALAPFLAAASALCAVAGVLTPSISTVVLGSCSAVVYVVYYLRVAAIGDYETCFESAFGADWDDCIPAYRKSRFLRKSAAMRLPAAMHFKLERDLAYATVPGSGRQLLCDVWRPEDSVPQSGLAFIYLHGSAWYYLDKDAGTRTFFRHLTAQGHVVMDVAYRLFPETDIKGMIQDAKRAIGWMKTNASTFGTDPNKIVIGGGSAGGHIALMVAYTANDEMLAPPEMKDLDLSVKAVVSLYGPPDLRALYFHTDQQITTRKLSAKTGADTMPKWMAKKMGKDFLRLGMNKSTKDAGAMASILGGHPEECPELYDYYSPTIHVDRHCPPTLQMQGEHDVFTPVSAARHLYLKLQEAGVPAVFHALPQTDHAFDLFMPRFSAVAHTAYYFVERFLARMACELPKC